MGRYCLLQFFQPPGRNTYSIQILWPLSSGNLSLLPLGKLVELVGNPNDCDKWSAGGKCHLLSLPWPNQDYDLFLPAVDRLVDIFRYCSDSIWKCRSTYNYAIPIQIKSHINSNSVRNKNDLWRYRMAWLRNELHPWTAPPFARLVRYIKRNGIFTMSKGVHNKQYTPEFKQMVVETGQDDHIWVWEVYDWNCKAWQNLNRRKIQ